MSASIETLVRPVPIQPRADHAIVNINGAPTAITLTEDNIARVFAATYAGKLLFDHTSGRWLQWDSSRWKPETTRLAYHYTRELTRGLNADGSAKWAKASVFAAVETIAQTDRAFACTLDQFDVDPWRLGTPGGIVDLRTGALLPADPAAMITRSTSVAPAPGTPIKWLQFLAEATRLDDELIKFLQRLCGYALTGLTREQILLFIYGPGGNGKGVFINTISRVMGDYAQAADMRTFTASKWDRHPTELAALRGARLVTATETEAGAEWAESRVKQLTGGDMVRARFMRCDEFEYRPQFQLVIVGNHRPRLRDVGDAMRRRLRLVDFMHKPAIVNDNLEIELQAEAPQILHWMINGCMDWFEDGLPVPECVRVATDEYFREQDSFADWLAQDCEVAQRYTEKSAPMFRAWSDFCHASGDHPGTQVRFADELKARGYTKRHTMAGAVWLGIRLKPRQAIPDRADPKGWD